MDQRKMTAEETTDFLHKVNQLQADTTGMSPLVEDSPRSFKRKICLELNNKDPMASQILIDDEPQGGVKSFKLELDAETGIPLATVSYYADLEIKNV